MHRESILIVLGVITAVMPYLGLPYGWLMFALPVLGLLILIIGLSLRMKRRAREMPPVTTPNEAHSAV